MPAPALVRRWVRALGERDVLTAVEGVVVARPPMSNHELVPLLGQRKQRRADQYEAVITQVTRYNKHAVICAGVPFGHTRPQWILPYGGSIQLDGHTQAITADYGFVKQPG
ncbi:putative S66 family peptidase [Arthrobacter globiformis NBRC 12137]|uniref:Putative S66 family peptidase n=2 Tax=Arthrobacter globiformis TaxID=1665 RepID=H0QJP0_ARTG1|nr:putative S66 family peptidase [Arthrobacter globiformis NBRC 12137]